MKVLVLPNRGPGAENNIVAILCHMVELVDKWKIQFSTLWLTIEKFLTISMAHPPDADENGHGVIKVG